MSLGLFFGYDWLPINLVKNALCYSCLLNFSSISFTHEKCYIPSQEHVFVLCGCFSGSWIVASLRLLACYLNEKNEDLWCRLAWYWLCMDPILIDLVGVLVENGKTLHSCGQTTEITCNYPNLYSTRRKQRSWMLPPAYRVSQRFLTSRTPALLSTVSFYPPSRDSKLKTMPFTFHCPVTGFVCYF